MSALRPHCYQGGVLVTQKATVTFGGDSYFFLAIFYVTVVCLGIKLVACSLQQKGGLVLYCLEPQVGSNGMCVLATVIGEKLGDKVGVRAAIGVNSLTIRAIRRVLMEKGLSLGKVCILCGMCQHTHHNPLVTHIVVRSCCA